MITKKRLHYFDMLKGIAIFMVIMGHIITMCIREIDSAPLFKFIEKIHMPIFFFISGYFTYKVNEKGKLLMPKLVTRVKQLLLPFFIMSTLWIYYFPHSGLQSPFVSTWEGLYFNVGKNGYWFTLCLFEIILLYCTILPLLSVCRTVFSKVIAIAVIWLFLGFVKDNVPETISSLLGLPLIYEFFPVFMMGVVARSAHIVFDRITSSNVYITTSMIIGSFLMYYVCWSWEFPNLYEWFDLMKCLLYLCVIIVTISIVKPWAEKSFDCGCKKGGIFARIWEYLGSQSLAIYVLHYFFLFPMPLFREPLVAMNLGLIPTALVSSFFAVIVISVVLGVNYVIGKSDILALLMTGKIK